MPAVPLLPAQPRAVTADLLTVSEVSHGFRADGARLEVLDRVSLRLPERGFAAVVGPSGSGKSTLLNLIAGLDEPSSGSITVAGTGPRLGRVGYMPQRDLLHPWRSALDNATVALEVRGVPKREARARAAALFRDFGLEGFERTRPNELSGGMRQRVALARTVLTGANLILLDEPFGALDALTRARLHEWLLATWPSLGAAGLLVTHDVDEALLLADDVYVLTARPGRIALHVTPPFARPRTRAVTADPRFGALRLELLAALGLVTEGAP